MGAGHLLAWQAERPGTAIGEFCGRSWLSHAPRMLVCQYPAAHATIPKCKQTPSKTKAGRGRRTSQSTAPQLSYFWRFGLATLIHAPTSKCDCSCRRTDRSSFAFACLLWRLPRPIGMDQTRVSTRCLLIARLLWEPALGCGVPGCARSSWLNPHLRGYCMKD